MCACCLWRKTKMKWRSLQNKEANNRCKKKGTMTSFWLMTLTIITCCRGALVKVQSLARHSALKIIQPKWRTSPCQLSITNKLSSHSEVVKSIHWYLLVSFYATLNWLEVYAVLTSVQVFLRSHNWETLKGDKDSDVLQKCWVFLSK